jgi:hypothetical protein
MSKNFLLLLFIILFSFFISQKIIENRYSYLYGEKYKVENVAYMYWYPKNDVTNVSYYKLNKNDIVYCKGKSGDFILCAWKFSLIKEPLFGWIKMEKINYHE